MSKETKIKIFKAKKVVTMNSDQPTGEAVAVEDGRILAVGSADELHERFEDAQIDDSLAEKVLTPGLIDAHCHMQMEGTFWNFAWIGYFDRVTPEGSIVHGIRSVSAVVDRLKELNNQMSDPNEPLVAWGFDPILLKDEDLTIDHLDQVSTSRSVLVVNASGHIFYANSALLKKAKITSETKVDGVIKGEDGSPNGILEEMPAMLLVAEFTPEITADAKSPKSIRNGAKLAQRAGCTTASELACFMGPAFDSYQAEVAKPDFPVRVAVSPLASAILDHRSPEEAITYLKDVRKEMPEKMILGPTKWIVDGSIQGYTADLMWPGYCGSHSNPMINTPLEMLHDQIAPFHNAGFQIAMHTNGDGATEIALKAVEELLDEAPRLNHRHRLEHCQVASHSQFERIANLGMCVNLFSNHVYYWGDQHRAKTLGPDKTLRMDATGTALSLGVHFSLHSDSPVTPIGPLFSAWCAVNRKTLSGRVLGENERISVEDALAAVTIGSAYLLHRDGELGSIEVGKLADFTVFDEDPLSAEPEKLKDVPIWGTVLGGEIQKAA